MLQQQSESEARRGGNLDASTASCVVTVENTTKPQPDFQAFSTGDALRVFEFLLSEAVDGEPAAILALGKLAGYSISKVAVRYAVRNGVAECFALILERVLKDEDSRRAAVSDAELLLQGIARDTASAAEWERSGGPERERRRERRELACGRRRYERWIKNYEARERAELKELGKHLNAERAERMLK